MWSCCLGGGGGRERPPPPPVYRLDPPPEKEKRPGGIPPERTRDQRPGGTPPERTRDRRQGDIPTPVNGHACENITSRRTFYAGENYMKLLSRTYFMVVTCSVFCFSLSSSFFCRCLSLSCLSSICFTISHRNYKTEDKPTSTTLYILCHALGRVRLERADCFAHSLTVILTRKF